jgi:hypothetical protein
VSFHLYLFLSEINTDAHTDLSGVLVPSGPLTLKEERSRPSAPKPRVVLFGHDLDGDAIIAPPAITMLSRTCGPAGLGSNLDFVVSQAESAGAPKL